MGKCCTQNARPFHLSNRHNTSGPQGGEPIQPQPDLDEDELSLCSATERKSAIPPVIHLLASLGKEGGEGREGKKEEIQEGESSSMCPVGRFLILLELWKGRHC